MWDTGRDWSDWGSGWSVARGLFAQCMADWACGPSVQCMSDWTLGLTVQCMADWTRGLSVQCMADGSRAACALGSGGSGTSSDCATVVNGTSVASGSGTSTSMLITAVPGTYPGGGRARVTGRPQGWWRGRSHHFHHIAHVLSCLKGNLTKMHINFARDLHCTLTFMSLANMKNKIVTFNKMHVSVTNKYCEVLNKTCRKTCPCVK